MKLTANAFLSSVRAAAFATITVTSLGHAADQTWISANSNNDWNTTTAAVPQPNWDAGVAWTQDNHAIFGGNGETVTLTEAISASGITFNVGDYNITGNTLTLASDSFIHTAANNTTINSTLAGGGIVKSGSGTLTLGGANTFSTGLTLSAGTLISNVDSALGTGTVTLGDANTGSSDVTLFHQVGAGTSAATNVVVSASGSGLAQIKWSQDWWGSSGKSYNTANDWTLTLNRMVNFQCTNNKQIAPFVTGSGVAAGNVAIKVDGGAKMTWTAAMNATNTQVQVNDFTGNVWITGNTTLQGQNRSYQSNTTPYYNGLIPDSATLIVDSGSTFQLHHGAETVGFLSGAGTVLIGTGTGGNALTIAGSSSTPATGGQTGTATFSGTFSTNQSALTKNGTGTQELSGTGITFTAGVNLNDGKLMLTKTTAWNSNIAFGATNNPTLQLNAPLAADSWTFAKQLTGGSSAAKIEKTGAGTLILTPAASSSFVGSSTGALTVSEGKLYQNNGNFTTAPAVSVANGATIGGTGTVGDVTVANGGTLEGGSAGSGTLTAGNVTIGSVDTDLATLKATLSTTSGYKALAVTNLTLNGGSKTVTLDASGLGLANGTAYDLLVSTKPITAPNAASVVAALKSNSRTYTPVVDATGTKIQLLYDSNASVYWVGTSNAWNTTSTNDWKLTGNHQLTTFQVNDTVFFHDNPVSADVNINDADVTPLATVFDNSTATEYVIDGSFGIATGSITKNGNGLVGIHNQSNPTTGAINLNGGTLLVWYPDGLGSGPLNFDGGTLQYDGSNPTWPRTININSGGGTIDVNSGQSINHSGTWSGSGTLAKAGDGTLTLGQNSGTVAGSFAINAGVLNLDWGAGSVTYSGSFSGSGGILRLSGNGANGSSGLTLTGNNTFSGTTELYGRRIFLNSATTNHAIAGNITIKQGNWTYHGLTVMDNEQIADTAVLRFENTNNAYDFRLNGKTETLGGIESLGSGQSGGTFCIIENAGYDGGNDTGIAEGTLNVSGSGTYLYHGQLRNQNGGNNGALNFGKSGTGTQTLTGTGINYTGTTTVNGGTLELNGTTSFASSAVTVNSGTLLVNNSTGTGTGSTATLTVNSGGTLSGAGSVGGSATIAGGATLAPGNNGVGTLGANNLSLSGTCQIQLDASTSDLVAVTGTLSTSGSPTLNISSVGTPSAASYTIMTYGTLNGDLPTVTGIPSGYVLDTATTGQIKLVSSTGGFDSWAASFPGLSDTTPGGDPDNDGVTNLVEYVIGGDPRVSSTEFLPTQTIVGPNIVISYQRSDASEADTTQIGQWSGTLGEWTDVTPDLVSENGDQPDDMTITIPLSNAVNGKLFGRLKVTQP